MFVLFFCGAQADRTNGEKVEPTPARGARIAFDETRVDLGDILVGQRASAEYSFQNVGDEPLAILEIKTSCGVCSTVVLKKRDIAPGEKTAIRAEIDTRKKTGAQSYFLHISTNDAQSPQTALTLKANIRPKVEWKPETLGFGKAHAGSPTSGTVTVSFMSVQEIAIESVLSNESLFDVKVEKKETPAQEKTAEASGPNLREFSVLCSLRRDAPKGFFVEEIVLRTNNPDAGRVSIPVSGEIVEAVGSLQ